ncbi:MAG: sigma 54-interacting transcriptional regulator, partial [Myxococcales bacterium]
DSDKVSRMHARVRRIGDTIEVEDLGSRNGTRVNGDKIEGPRKLVTGDEVVVGPILAVVGVTSGLRRTSAIADTAAGEARLAAEVDRSVRYHRPVTVAMLRVANDVTLDQIERAIRPMDLIAEDAGDDYLLIVPELSREDGAAAVQRLLDFARAGNVQATAVTALCPDDGTTVETLIGVLRAGLRTGRVPRAPAPKGQPIVLDPAMQRVYTLVQRIADTSMTVLILGETGVGKELVCEAIHQRSSRRDRPLIKLNCAALPETLLESELFGYEKGAFTGADKRKVGFFEAADGGTLFLDEIGEMPLPLQAKLLRVLERKVITRVGGTSEVATDARLIAATHRNLDADVRAGRFRQDLLFRIGGFTIAVPPLRDRQAEIIPLAEHFAKTTASEQGRPAPTLGADASEALSSYGWPGNVRELKNAMDYLAATVTEPVLEPGSLPPSIVSGRPIEEPKTEAPLLGDLYEEIRQLEKRRISETLEAAGGVQVKAAELIGMPLRTFAGKVRLYGLHRK